MCQVYFCSNLHVLPHGSGIPLFPFCFALCFLLFCIVLFCFVDCFVSLCFSICFVVFLFLFCSLHCKDCKAPGRIQGAALDLCMLAARFFAELLIFHWFYKVYITPAGSNKSACFPTFLHFFAELCAASIPDRQEYRDAAYMVCRTVIP